MTTFNTGNPIGSKDPRDLYDNSENLDVFINDKTKTHEKDRLGVERRTWHGIEQEAQLNIQQAIDAKNAAQEAAMMSGFSKYADTLAQLESGIGTDYIEGDVVMVFQDESRGDTSSIYKVESGAAEFKLTFDKTRQDLLSFTGNISADAEWSDVPAHSDPAFDVQAQALANRTEMLTYGIGAYNKIREYVGSGTRLKVQDPTGVYWWVRRGTASDNGGTVLKDGLGRSWEREYSGSLFVSWFGTDTNAIQKALSTPDKSIRFDDGVTFITNETVLSTADDRTIYGGGWIKCSTPEINVFELYGARNKVSINIDCDNQASAGIVIPRGYGDDFDIFGCRVIKVRSTIKQAFGIVSWSAAQGRIHDNIVEDVFSLGDSGGASIANGLARGIQVVPDGPLTGAVSIYNNTVRRIYGEEGDAISVQIADTPPFPTSKCIIENNTIENFSRRAVKVQCSYAVVKGNTCISDDDIAHERTSNAISVIASDGCEVADNMLRLNGKFVGISVSGDGAGRDIVGNNVSGNTIIDPRVIGITVKIAEGTSVKCNTIRGSEITPISVVNAPATSVVGNVLSANVVMSTQEQIICAYSPRSVISENVINGHTIYRGIRLTSQYSTVSGNKILGSITSAAFSGPNASNLEMVKGSAIVGNFVRNGSSPMFLNFGGAATFRIADNVLLGEGSSESGINSVTIGANSIPSRAYPTQYFSKGTLAINLSASGGSVSGWICVEAGTPGVWKALGLVEP